MIHDYYLMATGLEKFGDKLLALGFELSDCHNKATPSSDYCKVTFKKDAVEVQLSFVVCTKYTEVELRICNMVYFEDFKPENIKEAIQKIKQFLKAK